MKKLIFLFLLWGIFCNAQYNLFARQNFNYKTFSTSTNTEIGGIAATINTPALLATKLGIDVSRITNFSTVGSDIKCRITGSYTILQGAFNNDVNINSYVDSDNLVTDLGINAFKFNAIQGSKIKKLEFKGITTLTGNQVITDSEIEEFYLPNCVSVPNSAFIYDPTFSKNKRYYIPLCTSLGSSALDNSVFTNIKSGCAIICHPSLATNNGGNPDGDIAYAISQGATIRYKTNSTAPNQVTDLSAGIIYNTAIKLNFTPPTGSTNAIDFYECYANGVLKNTITASGQYITGLAPNTFYNITLKAVDIFYNKSTVSNSLSVSTSLGVLPNYGLVSYYKLDGNSNDSFGSNNGVDTSVAYVSGKIGNAASFNGTTSKTVMGNPDNLQLSTGSISCWIKTSNAGSSYRSIFGKILAYNMFLKDGVLVVYNWSSYGTTGDKTTGVNLNDGIWHHVVFVFESNTSLNYLYIDGILKLTFSWAVSAQTDNFCIGASNTIQYINAVIDEGSVYNRKLTQTDIDLLYNSGNGVTL